MKKIITFFLLLITSWNNLATAQAPNWLWAKSTGGASDDGGGVSVSTDVNGNVLMTGIFVSPTISFGTITLTNADPSSRDIFIVKYDTSGNVLWAKSAGGSSDDYSYDVSTDASGNLYLTGYFQSPTITFGTTTLTNAGFGDLFIVKYDVNGNVLWAKRTGGTSVDGGTSVSTDANGNVLMTGSFQSPTIIFGTTTLTNAGSSNIFIVKYDANGNVLWAKLAGGTSDDIAYDVSTDASGNSFITGNFNSPTIIFGADTLTNSNAGSSDIFIAKYDASGNVLWAKSAGGNSVDDASGVSTDANGNVFMTGYFLSFTITFGTTILTNASAGFEDIFIVKYDSNGNALWAKRAGGGLINDDVGFSISTDSNGNALMTGYFESPTITFGTATLTNTSAGDADIFIVKFDTNGNVLWAKSAGGTNDDFGHDIFTVANGSSYITGLFQSPTITFGTTTLTNSGTSLNKIFIAKLDETTIGIEEFSEHSDLSIAPNPLNSESTITFNKEQINTTIKITDVLGKEIKTTTFSGKQYVIEKGDLKAGIYYLRSVDEKKNVLNAKIIIQ